MLITAIVVFGLFMMGLNYALSDRPRRRTRDDEVADAKLEKRLKEIDGE